MSQLSRLFPAKMLKIWLPLVFITAVISHFPAQLVWRYAALESYLPKTVSVSALGGTIWNGWAIVGVNYKGQRLEVRQEWQLGLGALWRSGEMLVLTMTHPGSLLKLKASPSLSFDKITGSLNGNLNPLLINPVLRQNKAWISGDIRVNQLDWTLLGGRPVSLNGSVIWQGGDTYFIPPGSQASPQLIQYPQLALQVSTSEQSAAIQGRVIVLGQDESLAEVELDSQGWLSAVVYGRLKQAVPALPVPRKPAEQTLVKYKEKVF